MATNEYAGYIYLQLKSIASLYDIDFHLYLESSGGFGELCMDWDELNGYALYGDERGEKHSLFTTHEFEEFKYEVFLQLCFRMGLEYEMKHRNLDYLRKDEDDLEGDTRKIAFEETIRLLTTMSADWAERAAEQYTKYLNMWRRTKNVQYDFETSTFRTVD
ncbi:hypothetical protein HB852_07690 [Listeria grandensis]|uniref:Immunity protein 63 domain-containing protein n=1 Tax=Listeria grandensis TaxID=1494963 RepID=A0A7X0Y251_9LIST|nr:Imm63 family immunity protein [Listeria grandensis]MBC1474497.1 hypothetical protein [Listeria grandensis]MBC1935626.1 hypothetical protein [Listeria grandensis]